MNPCSSKPMEEVGAAGPVFFAGYSLLFYLWVKTFLYTLPFLAGFLIALAIQPLAGLFQERLRIPRGGAALATHNACPDCALRQPGLIGRVGCAGAHRFLNQGFSNGVCGVFPTRGRFLEQAEGFLGQLDLSFLERHRQEAAGRATEQHGTGDSLCARSWTW